jgi:CHASE3 domain sensor protein
MSDDRNLHLKQQLFDDIWEEIGSLKGKELDDYLASIGLSPEDLLQDYSKKMNAAIAAPKRARFEEALRLVRQKKAADFRKIVSLDVARKKQMMAAVRDHADRTNEMTIAARNRKIEDENDLDVFLEACLRLGVIDSDGNLKG